VLTPRVDIFPDVNDLEFAAAQAVVAAITGALHERGRCLIALSGGRTPQGVYYTMGTLLAAHAVDMSQVHMVFVDERMVPATDPASNYGMVRRELFSRIDVPPSHIHRIRGELAPEAAADEYEQTLQGIHPLFGGRCDLTILGVGEDGHTASLFPGTTVLRERERTVRAVFVPQLAGWRVTLTLPVINRSRAVMFLATGEQKAGVVGHVLSSAHPREDMPATMVRPEAGTIRWMLDAKAASQVPSQPASRRDAC
jgi:6-phosphogluconolactonase